MEKVLGEKHEWSSAKPLQIVVSLFKRDGAQLGCSSDCWKTKLMIITLDPPAEWMTLDRRQGFSCQRWASTIAPALHDTLPFNNYTIELHCQVQITLHLIKPSWKTWTLSYRNWCSAGLYFPTCIYAWVANTEKLRFVIITTDAICIIFITFLFFIWCDWIFL